MTRKRLVCLMKPNQVGLGCSHVDCEKQSMAMVCCAV